MKVGILTGGGDCPGLNAVIRAAGRRVMTREGEVVGVLEGWKGLVEGLFSPVGPSEISGLLPRGGTILRTTRTNPFKVDGGVEKVLANFEREGFDALVRLTTTSRRPITRSGSTRRSRSQPKRSTGFTRPRSRTTA